MGEENEPNLNARADEERREDYELLERSRRAAAGSNLVARVVPSHARGGAVPLPRIPIHSTRMSTEA